MDTEWIDLRNDLIPKVKEVEYAEARREEEGREALQDTGAEWKGGWVIQYEREGTGVSERG